MPLAEQVHESACGSSWRSKVNITFNLIGSHLKNSLLYRCRLSLLAIIVKHGVHIREWALWSKHCWGIYEGNSIMNSFWMIGKPNERSLLVMSRVDDCTIRTLKDSKFHMIFCILHLILHSYFAPDFDFRRSCWAKSPGPFLHVACTCFL